MRAVLGIIAVLTLTLFSACSGDVSTAPSPREGSSDSSTGSARTERSGELSANALREALEDALPASGIELAEEVPSPQATAVSYGINRAEPDWTAVGFPEDGITGSAYSTNAMSTKQRNASLYVNLFVIDAPAESDLCEIPWQHDRTDAPCEVIEDGNRTVVTQAYTNLYEYYVVMPGFVISVVAGTAREDGSPRSGPLPIPRNAVGGLAYAVVDELV